MARLYYDGDVLRLKHFEKGESYLFRKPFLHLKPAKKYLGDSGELKKPDHSAIKNIANIYLFKG
jgi:hypothetical protein